MMNILLFIILSVGMFVIFVLSTFVIWGMFDIIINYVVREDDANYPKEKIDKEQDKLFYPSLIISSIFIFLISICIILTHNL